MRAEGKPKTVNVETVNVAEATQACFLGYVRMPVERILSNDFMFGGE